MRIESVTLTRFRSGVDLTLPLAPRTFICGLNGAGKTSIREALKWGLTGRCDGTDAKGAGAEVLIPLGQKDAAVSLHVEGLGKVSRSYSPHGGTAFSVEGFTGTAQIQQAALYAHLHTSPAFVEAVLDTEAFFRLHHGDAKALVMGLLNVRVPVGDERFTLDELDAKHKAAFEERKLAKRNLQGVRPPEAPAPPATILDRQGQPVSPDAVETQLTKLSGELGALQQETGGVIATRQGLEGELARLKALPTPVPVDPIRQQVIDLETEIERLEQAIVRDITAEAPSEGPERVAFLQQRLDTLKQHTPANGCVMDPSVKCKTQARFFKDRVEALQWEIDHILAREEPEVVPAPESPLAAHRRRLPSLQQELARAEAAQEGARAAKKRMAEVVTELGALPTTEAQEQAIETLKARIAKGEALLAAARGHQQAIAAFQTAQARHQTLKDEVERLESEVDLLGPNGVRVQALSEALGAFTARINASLQPWSYEVAFSLDPWDVVINSRPFITYSKSERWRIAMAIQLAIAELSGLGIAVLDEIDMLTNANRNALASVLMQSPLTQIIFLGSRDESAALPKVKGVLSYRLAQQDGLTVVQEEVAA